MAEDYTIDNPSIESLSPQETEYSISFPLEANTEPLTLPEAETRAKKIDYALGTRSPGPEILRNTMMISGEESIRENLAMARKIQQASARDQVIKDQINKMAIEGATSEEMNRAAFFLAHPSNEAFNHIPSQYIVEHEFGEQAMLDYRTERKDGEESDIDNEVQDHAGTYIGMRQQGEKRLSEFRKRYSQEGYGDFALDLLEIAIPFLGQYQLSGALPGSEEGSLLTGNNLRDQASDLWASNSIEEFDSKFTQGFENVWAKNPTNAMTWAHYMLNYTAGETAFLNALVALDVISVPFTGTAAKIALTPIRSAKAGASIVKAASAGAFSPLKVADAIGKKEVALALALKQAKESLEKSGVRPESFDELSDKIAGLVNPATVYGGAYSYVTREAARRSYANALDSGVRILNDFILNPQKIDRLSSSPALSEALTRAEEIWNLQLPAISNRVYDVKPVTTPELSLTGNHMAEVKMGDAYGLPFDTEDLAKAEMKALGILNGKIEPEGAKWYISIKRPIPENDPDIQKYLIFGDERKAPVTALNTFFRYFKGHETLLDKETALDYKAGQYGASYLSKLFQNEARAIANLPRLRTDSRKALADFLQSERVAPSADGKTVGEQSRSLGEFETKFLKLHNRLPTEAEGEAYWAFHRINNADILLRNIGMLRDKFNAGIENFRFKYATIPDPEPGRSGTPTASMVWNAKDVEGKTVKELPWETARTTEDTGVFILGRTVNERFSIGNKKDTNYFRLKFTNEKDFEAQFGGGKWRIIQLTHQGEEQLRALPGLENLVKDVGRVRFLVLRDAKPQPLKFWQIPARDGFHIKYPNSGSYVVQPNMSLNKKWYRGDTSFLYQALHTDAVRLAEVMEHGRQIAREIVAGRATKADLARVINGVIPRYDPDRFMRLFTGDKPVFSLDAPFLAKRSGETSYDAHRLVDRFPGLKKESDSVYNLYKGFDMEYAMKRDLPLLSVENRGTVDAPIYDLIPAQMADPVGTINSAMASQVRSIYLDDLKIKQSRKFVQLFSHLLDPKISKQELLDNAIKYTIEPPWRSNIADVDRTALAAGKNYSMVAREFFKVQNEVDRDLTWIEHKIIQDLYKGKEPGNVSKWFWSTIKNPSQFLRAYAFNTKLGFFNPAQFFKQMNTMVSVAAISNPKLAAQGLWAGLASRALLMSYNPERLAYIATKSKKWGFKNEDHFIEAFNALRNSGFHSSNRAFGELGNFTTPKTIQGPIGKFLDWGQTPFRVGDQLPRLAAYFTAYNEWRTANPLGKLSNQAALGILGRADLLTNRMSAISNSQAQRGWAGVMTQFTGWQMRIAEDFIGKRLTRKEKAKLFLTYSALYGTPVAASGVLVYPFNQQLREWELAEPGLPTDNDNIAVKAVRQGVMTPMLESITGKRYNVQDLGPSGITFLGEILDGDKSVLDFMLGVSGTVFADTFKAGEPFLGLLIDTISGTGQYTLTGQDYLDLLRPISSVKQLDSLIQGMMYGRIVSKSGDVVLDDISHKEALATFLTGVQDQRVVDTYLRQNILKDRKEWQQKMTQQYERHLRRGIEAFVEGRDTDGYNEFRKASFFLDNDYFTPAERGLAMQRALKGYETRASSVAKRLAETSPEQRQKWLQDLKGSR